MFVTSNYRSPSQSSFFKSLTFSSFSFLIFILMGRCFGILSTTSRSSFAGDCALLATNPQATTTENRKRIVKGDEVPAAENRAETVSVHVVSPFNNGRCRMGDESVRNRPTKTLRLTGGVAIFVGV